MSGKSKARSIFDLVAERRNRSPILSQLSGALGSEETVTSPNQMEVNEVAVKPTSLSSLEDSDSILTKVSDNQEIDNDEEVLSPTGTELPVEEPSLAPEEIPGEQVAPLMASAIGIINEPTAPKGPVEDLSIEIEEKTEETRPEQEMKTESIPAPIVSAQTERKEAVETAPEKIETPSSTLEEKSDEEHSEMLKAVEALEPIIDLSGLPKTQPGRVLKKSLAARKPSSKVSNSKKKASGEAGSKAKEKVKRVTLLDSYFNDL